MLGAERAAVGAGPVGSEAGPLQTGEVGAASVERGSVEGGAAGGADRFEGGAGVAGGAVRAGPVLSARANPFAAGPRAPALPTFGEALLVTSRSRGVGDEGAGEREAAAARRGLQETRRRTLIVFVPRVPARFALLASPGGGSRGGGVGGAADGLVVDEPVLPGGDVPAGPGAAGPGAGPSAGPNAGPRAGGDGGVR